MAATHSLDIESGSTQYASIADGSQTGLDITGDMTIEFWLNIESITIGINAFVSKYQDTTQKSFLFSWHSAGSWRLYNSSDGSTTNTTTLTGGSAPPTGIWTHYAMVYDASAGSVTVYKNGDQEATGTGAETSLYNSTAAFSVGAYNTGTTPAGLVDGKMRNVRIWSDIRTQTEIRDNMNQDTPVGDNLQGNWTFNNVYTDSSGNGNTLTASGSPVFATAYPDAIDLVENSNWSSNHKITVQSSQVSGSSDLSDYPLVLTEDNFLAGLLSDAQADGDDLRFSLDIDGKQRLAHEVVSFNGTTAEVWVRVHTLSYNSDTEIYVHYGNGSVAGLNEAEAFGKHQVWVSGWKGMYPLASITDSTSNSHDLTNNNSVAFASSQIGNGADAGATNTTKYLSINDDLDITNGSITVFLWHLPNATPTSGDIDTLFEHGDSGTNVRYWIRYSDAAGTPTVYFNRQKENIANNQVSSAQTLSTSDPSHLILEYDGTNVEGFLNASSLGTIGSTGNGASGVDIDYTYLFAGRSQAGAIQLHASGMLDTVMIYSGTVSDDYKTTIYNNQNDTSTFAIPTSTAAAAVSSVTLNDIQHVSTNRAIATITLDNQTSVIEVGVVVATTSAPDTTSLVFKGDTTLSQQTIDITRLDPNTRYYIRPYFIE